MKKLIKAYDEAVEEFNNTEASDGATLKYLEGYMLGLKNAIAIVENQWISVKDRLPETGDNCAFIVDDKDINYHGRVLGGRYQGCEFDAPEFSVPGCWFVASHWLPLPAPPIISENESLERQNNLQKVKIKRLEG